jgi:hypothetical protein
LLLISPPTKTNHFHQRETLVERRFLSASQPKEKNSSNLGKYLEFVSYPERITAMNTLAYSFKQILGVLAHRPECEALESQLADFASRIGAAGQTLVYCQQERERFLPVSAVVKFLAPYGIELRGEWCNGQRLIYADVKPVEPSPFANSQVLEHVRWEVAA